MLLTIDVGNSNIVFALLDGLTTVRQQRCETHGGQTRGDYEVILRDVLGESSARGAILSSVVPSLNPALCAAAQAVTGKTCLVVRYDMKMPMTLRVDEPPTIGADLITGCVGAMESYPLPLAVADLGTANTVMVVNDKKEFLGGLIAPGLTMQLTSLGAGTSLLPQLSVSAPDKCIGSNTVACLESGVVYGTAAMLDGMIDRMNAELGQELTVIVTGGLSALVAPLCRHSVIRDPDLINKGMVTLYEMNQ